MHLFQVSVKFRTMTRWLMAWLAAVATLPALAVTLSSGLEPTTIRVDESAMLKITYVGGAPSSLPIVPTMPNLTIVRSGEMREAVTINGQQSTTLTLFYRVTASQPGIYSIPPITSMIGNSPLPTPEMKLTVLGKDPRQSPSAPTAPPVPAPVRPQPQPQPQPAPPPPAPAGPEPTFIRLLIPRDEVYLGEVFPVEIDLYYQIGTDIQLPNLRCDGFTVNRMLPSQVLEVVNGVQYRKVLFRTVAIPVKVGKLNFGPAECNLTIQVRRDAFSPAELRQVSPTTPPHIINVLPLPTNGVPPDFRGAVGNFQMTVTAGPTTLTVGDPITMRMQIAGRGSLDNVLMPSTESWRDFKSYPATFKLDAPDILSMSGIKSFEQIIVPQNAEIKELPSLSLSFFDPEQKVYRTLTNPPIPLKIAPHTGAAQQPTVLTNGTAAATGPTDIIHIKTYPGALGAVSSPLVTRGWFVVLQLVPIGIWAVLYARRRSIESLANNPRLRRHRHVIALVAKGLADLRQQAAQNQPETFYATAFRLLQEQLGERLDLPASAITEAIIDERLRPMNVPLDVQAAAHEAFQICNQARYARERTPQELASLAGQFERVLQQLQGIALPH